MNFMNLVQRLKTMRLIVLLAFSVSSVVNATMRQVQALEEVCPASAYLRSQTNLISQTDFAGNIEQFAYDDDNRLVSRQSFFPGTVEPQRSISYQYDRSNLLVGYADQHTATSRSYDEAGRLSHQNTVFQTGAGSFNKSIAYSYYKNGQLKTTTDAESSTTRYFYDEAGRLVQTALQGGGAIIVNEYNGELPHKLSYPGGVSRELRYDGFARLDGIEVSDNTGHKLMAHDYERDMANIVTRQTSLTDERAYRYDPAFRLTDSEVTTVERRFVNEAGESGENENRYPTLHTQYAYSANGNRLRVSKLGAIEHYHYDANHQLLRIGEGEDQQGEGEDEDESEGGMPDFLYDANGSTLQSGGLTYQYTAYNRLARVSAQGQPVADYEYDAFDRRISKQVDGDKVYFLYSEEHPGRLLGEYSESGSLIRGYSYDPGLGEPLAQKDGEGAYSYYHNDHLGTPQKLISAAGAVQWSGTYGVFGGVREAQNGRSNPLRFAGQYADAETGHYYNWRRYYHPGTGRYLSSDPIGLAGGIDRYSYVNNNPVNYIDPSGEVWFIAPLLRAGYLYAGFELLLFAYDVYDAANTFQDPCSSFGERFFAGSLLAASLFLPGGGYGKLDDVVPKGIPDSTLVCRGGTCKADNFSNGSGVTRNADGTLEGISTQSRPGASVEELSQPFRNGQVGVTTVGDIRAAGGRVVLDGTARNPNHATVGGITAEQAERLFTPTIPNPVPKSQRGL